MNEPGIPHAPHQRFGRRESPSEVEAADQMRAIEELNRARDTLKQNGIDTTLIKIRETSAQPAK